mgnify:CR=1 FL=1
MVMNIDTLTEKIYKEGIEQAESEARMILEKAQEDAKKIIEEAKENAVKVLEHAEREAKELKQNTLTDIRLAGNKATSSLKQEIKTLVKAKVFDEQIKETFLERDFVKELMLLVGKGNADNIDKIILPESFKRDFESFYQSSVSNVLPEIKVDFDKKLSNGFRFEASDSGYLITFTDEDFIEFFSPFLNAQTRRILFNDSK